LEISSSKKYKTVVKETNNWTLISIAQNYHNQKLTRM